MQGRRTEQAVKRRVNELLSAGVSRKAVAERLSLSTRTVKRIAESEARPNSREQTQNVA